MTNFAAEQLPKGWRYRIDGGDTEILFDLMSGTSRGIEAWVEIRSDSTNGVPEVFGRKDLTGANTVRDLTAAWDRNDRIPRGVLSELLRGIVYDVISRWRSGPDPVDLTTVASVAEKRWLLRPWIENSAPTRLIAAGNSSKSAFALAVGATIATGRNKILHGAKPTQTGPVAYLDWEANEATHKERLDAIERGAGIKVEPGLIHYFDMRRHGPLRRTSTALASRFHDLGIVFVVIDSVMLARGAGSEKRAAEDSTVDLYEALGEFACAALLIDHKNQATLKSKDKKGGYGSIVMDNSARLVWDMHQVAKLSNGRIRWTASNTKANNTAPQPDVSYEVAITSDRNDIWDTVTFHPISSITDGLSDPVNRAEQIELLLIEHDALTVSALAEHLSASESSVRSILSRDKGGRFRKLPDTVPPVWTLTANDPQQELPTPW